MQLLPMASSPDGLISARYAVITKTPGCGGGGGRFPALFSIFCCECLLMLLMRSVLVLQPPPSACESGRVDVGGGPLGPQSWSGCSRLHCHECCCRDGYLWSAIFPVTLTGEPPRDPSRCAA